MLYNFLLFIIYAIIGWVSTEGAKSQIVRLYDILLLGPTLVYLGFLQKNKIHSHILYFIGLTTITYNLKNYLVYISNYMKLKKIRNDKLQNYKENK